MAKSSSSISSPKDFIGKLVQLRYIQRGSEEITGEIVSSKDGNLTITQESRGSVYTYRIPVNEVPYIKGTSESKFEKGAVVTLERQINKRVKVTGTVLAFTDTTIVIDQGEKRGAMVTSAFPLANLEEISYREQTAEGKKASKERSERMRSAKSGKKDKSEKKGKKLKLKLKIGKKAA